MTALYSSCSLCPRACRVDRTAGQTGFCGMTDTLICARAALHHWEEPCISGTHGSGTVFFSGCNLRCDYCQNRDISRGRSGKAVTPERLCEILLSLQAQGAENINLVTPTHFLPHLLTAIPRAKEHGLTLPIVYNCGGYESVHALALLEGLVDIYLTDFKYMDASYAAIRSLAPDYPAICRAALREMVRQTGAPRFDRRGMLRRGTIVRHLVLPGRAEDAIALLDDLFFTYGTRILYSVMNQYTPPSLISLPSPLDAPLSKDEYARVLAHLDSLGIDAYTQEEGTVSESFIPPFDLTGI